MQMDYDKLRRDLVTELSLEGIAPEKQDELLGKMLEAILKKIFLSTMEKLGDDGVAEYEKMLEREAEGDEISTFLNEKIPNYDTFVQEIIDDFKKSMKAETV